MSSIRPFRIEIPQARIDDLRARLTATRWPHALTDDWSRGQSLPLMRKLAEHWAHGYDWRAHEAELNRHPQFLTEIDGQTIHFLHIKSHEPNAFPLILSHGWPSTVAEFLGLIGPLSNPRAHGLDSSLAFDLVIPSLPGFGFSSPLAGPGWDAARTATAWDTLMTRLGYTRYGAQGNDAGALVGRELGILQPAGLAGVHLQQIFAFPSGAAGEMDALSPFEQAGFANLARFQKYNGYADIQSKRPGTLAFGLSDSPVAQLAWNAELFVGFEGESAATMNRDRFLTHASIYWFTATGGQAAEFFFENARSGAGYRDLPTRVPTAVASFPADFRSVRSFAARSHTRLAQWTEMPRGGHFATEEEPKLLVDDMRRFFSALA